MQATVVAGDLADNIRSFRRHVQASNLRPRTIELYVQHASALAGFLAAQGMPQDVEHVRREHVEAYMVWMQERGSAANAAIHYRSLQQFFRWCSDEGEIRESPMAKMRPPRVPEKLINVIRTDALKLLFGTCGKGRSFEDRRDYAIMCLLLDTGMRRAELVGIQLRDLDLDQRQVKITGKGGRDRRVPCSGETVKALDRYLRIRRTHAKVSGGDLGERSALWLGRKGPLSGNGLYSMLSRRSREAGIERVHPHQWRHTFAHEWRMANGDDDGLMRVAGWRSREMLSRYGASAADERARETHKRASPLERLLRG